MNPRVWIFVLAINVIASKRIQLSELQVCPIPQGQYKLARTNSWGAKYVTNSAPYNGNLVFARRDGLVFELQHSNAIPPHSRFHQSQFTLRNINTGWNRIPGNYVKLGPTLHFFSSSHFLEIGNRDERGMDFISYCRDPHREFDQNSYYLRLFIPQSGSVNTVPESYIGQRWNLLRSDNLHTVASLEDAIAFRFVPVRSTSAIQN